MNTSHSRAQSQAVREIFGASMTALAGQMRFATEADRHLFVSSMQDHYEQLSHELSPDRPQWFDADERALLLELLEMTGDDEHPIVESVQRDDDLLRVALSEANNDGQVLTNLLDGVGERAQFAAMLTRPGIKEFLLNLDKAGIPVEKIDRMLSGVDWRNPPAAELADEETECTASTPGSSN